MSYAAIIAVSSLALLLGGALVWLLRRHVTTVEGRALEVETQHAMMAHVVAERDALAHKNGQLAADKAALDALLEQTAAELNAAREAVHDALRRKIATVAPSDVPALARSLLEERMSEMRARRAAADAASDRSDAGNPGVL